MANNKTKSSSSKNKKPTKNKTTSNSSKVKKNTTKTTSNLNKNNKLKDNDTKKIAIERVDSLISNSVTTNKNKKIKSNKSKEIKKAPKNNQNKKEFKKTENKNQSKLKLKKPVRYILILILSCTFLFAIGKIIFYFIDLYQSNKNHESLLEEVLKTETVQIIDEETGEIIEEEVFELDFEKLLAKNKDVKGWIRFNQNKINYPIVQGPDNEYYLRKNLALKYSTGGTIFLDYRNDSFDDQNAILFGHAMSNKTMFGTLDDVFHNSFWQNPENIEIITPDFIYTYQIFSYYTIEAEEYYITPSFASKEEFKKFIETIKSRSWQKLNVPVQENSHILTLSTCAGVGGTTQRRVIHAVRINEIKNEQN